MLDRNVNTIGEDREPRFFRGLLLAVLVCVAVCGSVARFLGCVSAPQLPLIAIVFARFHRTAEVDLSYAADS